jgi:hypothetical protein
LQRSDLTSFVISNPQPPFFERDIFIIMATLETQYKNFIDENPETPLSYDAWLKIKSDELAGAIMLSFQERSKLGIEKLPKQPPITLDKAKDQVRMLKEQSFISTFYL